MCSFLDDVLCPWRASNKLCSFDESFDIDPVASQEHLEVVCSELSEQAVLSSVICFLDTFKAYLGFNGIDFPVEPSTANGDRTFSQLLRQWADDPNFGGPQLLRSHTFGFDDDDHVAFIAIIAQSNVTWNDPVTERVTVYEHLVQIVDDLNAAAPSTMNSLLQVRIIPLLVWLTALPVLFPSKCHVLSLMLALCVSGIVWLGVDGNRAGACAGKLHGAWNKSWVCCGGGILFNTVLIFHGISSNLEHGCCGRLRGSMHVPRWVGPWLYGKHLYDGTRGPGAFCLSTAAAAAGCT